MDFIINPATMQSGSHAVLSYHTGLVVQKIAGRLHECYAACVGHSMHVGPVKNYDLHSERSLLFPLALKVAEEHV